MMSTETAISVGLTGAEAEKRLNQYGENRIKQDQENRVLTILGKFWAPVRWMLEATIVLEILARRWGEAMIIGVRLLFNGLLSFFQESQATRALALRRTRLAVRARVIRDAKWQLVPAEQLVPGDAIHLRAGDLVPADVRL